MSEAELFAHALQIDDPRDRDTFLDEACRADPELRRSVGRLLEQHFAGDEFLAGSTCDEAAAATGGQGTAPMSQDEDIQSALELLTPAAEGEGDLGGIDHYRVSEVIGRGQFGIVFKALDSKLNREVAIKMMLPRLAATSPARKRFLREAQAVARIHDVNVVRIFSIGEVPLPYIVMEHVSGETLQQRIVRTGPLDALTVGQLAVQIASGLTAAHAAGIVHRDIKPANILLEGKYDVRAVITDLGLARTVDDASLTQSGITAGTPLYMSPEQALSNTIDYRSDLFSLGSTLYAVLAGHSPFRARSVPEVLRRVALDTPRPLREIIPETPEWLATIIATLHQKDPDSRIQSARELTLLLRKCMAEAERGLDPAVLPDIVMLSRITTVSISPPISTSRGVIAARRRFGRDWRNVAIAVLVVALAVLAWRPGLRTTPEPSGEGTAAISPAASLAGTPAASTAAAQAVSPVTLPRPEELPVDSDQQGRAEREAAEEAIRGGARVWIRSEQRGVERLDTLPVPDGRFDVVNVEFQVGLHFRNECLRPLVRCRSLEEVAFRGVTNLSDAGLAFLEGLKVERLVLIRAPRITEAGIASLATCADLKRLHLETGALQDAALSQLAPLGNLYRVDLVESGVTDAGLSQLARACPQLIELGVTHETPLTFQAIKEFPNLRLLQVKGSQLTPAFIATINSRPQIEFLTLESPLTNDIFTRLKDLKAVFALHLLGSPADAATVTPAIYENLEWPAKLQNLVITGPSIAPTDAGLETIAKIPLLKIFSLVCRREPDSPPPYTLEGVARLQALRPELQIVDADAPPVTAPQAPADGNTK